MMFDDDDEDLYAGLTYDDDTERERRQLLRRAIPNAYSNTNAEYAYRYMFGRENLPKDDSKPKGRQPMLNANLPKHLLERLNAELNGTSNTVESVSSQSTNTVLHENSTDQISLPSQTRTVRERKVRPVKSRLAACFDNPIEIPNVAAVTESKANSVISSKSSTEESSVGESLSKNAGRKLKTKFRDISKEFHFKNKPPSSMAPGKYPF